MDKNKTATPLHYSAKNDYEDDNIVRSYEVDRFSGLMGRYRYRREQAAIRALVELLPKEVSIADCPCGTGRWWPMLLSRAKKITAIDISSAMRNFASSRAKQFPKKIEIMEGNAEQLPLENESVDYVFSHALTKHLPIPIQYQVLAEFSRVSKMGVICSFGIFSHLSYEIWRRRSLVESYPVFFEELEWMAKAAGLTVQEMRKCTTPIGVEHTVLFKKWPAPGSVDC